MEERPGLDSLLEHRALFVTGSDTEVGKTVVSCALARHWAERGEDVAAVKPIAAGGRRSPKGHFLSPDSQALAKVSSKRGRALVEKLTGQPLESPLVGFTQAIAPFTASQLDGVPINFPVLRSLIRRIKATTSQENVRLLLEGAGGVLVPVAERRLLIDLVMGLGISAVIVTRTDLGTINHTLMTLESLMRRKVPVAGIVFSRRRRGEFSMAEQAGLRELDMIVPRTVPLLLAPYSAARKPTLAPAVELWGAA